MNTISATLLVEWLLDLTEDTKLNIQELFELDKPPSLKESTSELSIVIPQFILN